VRHPGSVQGHRNYLAEMPSITTSGSGALQMLPLTLSGQPLEISLERLGQPMSLYVPLSKGTRHSPVSIKSGRACRTSPGTQPPTAPEFVSSRKKPAQNAGISSRGTRGR
jgi:hypothetical protein